MLRNSWLTVEHRFSNKSKTKNTNMLHENNYGMIKSNKKMSHTLNKYFKNLAENLRLKKTSLALKEKPLKHLLKRFKNESLQKDLEAF